MAAATNSNESYCTFTLASDVTAGGLPSEEEIAKQLESSDAKVGNFMSWCLSSEAAEAAAVIHAPPLCGHEILERGWGEMNCNSGRIFILLLGFYGVRLRGRKEIMTRLDEPGGAPRI